MHKIMSQSRVHSLRVLFGLPLLLIDPNELFAFTSVFAKTIVGDPIKPGGKFCFTTKAPDVLVSAKERVLRQIVGQRDVAPSELAQQTADGRLMTTDQLAISVLVVINKNSSDQAGIG